MDIVTLGRCVCRCRGLIPSTLKGNQVPTSLRNVRPSSCSMSTRASQTMRAWQIRKYGGIEQLELNHSAPIPPVTRPGDVLVKIHASSVNPIDYKTIEGYGKTMFNKMRESQGWLQKGSEFPLTPGKDFSGVVVRAGMKERGNIFKNGDEVWGAMTLAGSGCFADYAVMPSSCMSKKPTHLSHVEAASLPYVTITAWAALCTKAGLTSSNSTGKRVLILGGSGGVGTFAIQLLKAWGAEVTTTCAVDAVELVSSLGADTAFDYKAPDHHKDLHHAKGKGYDVILDLVADRPDEYMPLLQKNTDASYVTVVTSFIKDAEKHGLPLALSVTALTSMPQLIQNKLKRQNHYWAFANPSAPALSTVAVLANKEKIKPVVQEVFTFDVLPTALERLKNGGNRGKIVVVH